MPHFQRNTKKKSSEFRAFLEQIALNSESLFKSWVDQVERDPNSLTLDADSAAMLGALGANLPAPRHSRLVNAQLWWEDRGQSLPVQATGSHRVPPG